MSADGSLLVEDKPNAEAQILQPLARVHADRDEGEPPAVELTSSDEGQDVIQGHSVGVKTYVRKPIQFEPFSEALRLVDLHWPPNN